MKSLAIILLFFLIPIYSLSQDNLDSSKLSFCMLDSVTNYLFLEVENEYGGYFVLIENCPRTQIDSLISQINTLSIVPTVKVPMTRNKDFVNHKKFTLLIEELCPCLEGVPFKEYLEINPDDKLFVLDKPH